MNVSLPRLLLASAALALIGLSPCAAEETSTVKFSDPGKPGTLRVNLTHGDVAIRGTDAAEVVVKSDAKPHQQKRKDGLRVITETAGFSLLEKDNVITLETETDGWAGAPSDFRITVPRGTNVIVNSGFGGEVSCSGVSGDIEIRNLHGEISLADISGAVLVETTNGDITATIRELQAGKTVSFVTMNGEVGLRAPADLKANVRMRTHNGSIATDFDPTALVTKVESAPRAMKHRAVLSPEARQSYREVARVAVEAARHAGEAMREAAEAARQGIQEATGKDDKALPPLPPIPPMPAIPAMTGGKLVTGTLNGGGPEISVATMNGEVTLRKLEK